MSPKNFNWKIHEWGDSYAIWFLFTFLLDIDDLCVRCYKDKGHEYKVERLGLDLDLDQQQEQDDRKERPQLTAQVEERRLKLQRLFESLAHAIDRTKVNCPFPSCAKMKIVVKHANICKLKTSENWRRLPNLQRACSSGLLSRKALPIKAVYSARLSTYQTQTQTQTTATNVAKVCPDPDTAMSHGHHPRSKHAASTANARSEYAT